MAGGINMTKYLNEKGECNCKGLNEFTDGFYIIEDVDAQSRFHAEAIREALGMIEGNGMYKAGRSQFDAILKCMEGSKK
jgi:hypothetical protein